MSGDQRVPEFDVFLSHNSQDKAAVENIAERLRRDGLNPWFDKWHIKPGESIQAAIQRALPTCKSCAVFLGDADVGPWHEREMRRALSLQVETDAFPVIPVFLPSTRTARAERLPEFYRDLRWIEFPTLDDDEAFRLLTCGIRGEFTLPTQRLDEAEEQENIVPHGLRSFTADDSRFFLRLIPGPRDHRDLPTSIAFWKDRLEQVDPDRTFSVGLLYGPSGCGKSSLVKAGLLPRLAEYVRPLYLEATPADTERELLGRLRRLVPGLPELDCPPRSAICAKVAISLREMSLPVFRPARRRLISRSEMATCSRSCWAAQSSC